jgi:predicted transcriptional regulator
MLSKSIGEFRKWKMSTHSEKAEDMRILYTATLKCVNVIKLLLSISDSVIFHTKQKDNKTTYLTTNYGTTSNNCKAKLTIPDVSFLKIIVTIQRLTLNVRSLIIIQN